MDISKAYDMIDWRVVRQIMIRMGFFRQWVDIIMLCVTPVSYSVVVNDQLVGPIKPKRGLRQGDPISSYLFIICAKGLSTLIKKAAVEGAIHGSQVS